MRLTMGMRVRTGLLAVMACGPVGGIATFVRFSMMNDGRGSAGADVVQIFVVVPFVCVVLAWLLAFPVAFLGGCLCTVFVAERDFGVIHGVAVALVGASLAAIWLIVWGAAIQMWSGHALSIPTMRDFQGMLHLFGPGGAATAVATMLLARRMRRFVFGASASLAASELEEPAP